MIQHHGALRYSVINTESARILVQESFGLDLRLASYDPGMSIGYRKYIAVQPRPAGLPLGQEGGYFWIEDPVSNNAGLYFKKLYGTELGFNRISNGLALGYERITIIVGPKSTEAISAQIDFTEDELATTRYLSQPGEPQ